MIRKYQDESGPRREVNSLELRQTVEHGATLMRIFNLSRKRLPALSVPAYVQEVSRNMGFYWDSG